MLDCVFDFSNNQKQPDNKMNDNKMNDPNLSRSDIT